MKTIFNIAKTLLIALVLLTTNTVNAQTQEQIYMGLRLPQMSSTDRENIGVSKFPQHAKGQMIFNTETNFVQYWNGDKWIQLESKEDVLKHIVNNFSTELGPEFIEYITNNINNGKFGDSILQYIITNIDQAFTDSVMNNVIVTSMNNLLTITKIGSSEFRFTVNIDSIMTQLLNNEEFITNLGNELIENNEFITNMFKDSSFTQNLETFIENTVLTEEFITNLFKDSSFTQNLETFIENTILTEEFITNLFKDSSFTQNLENFVETFILTEEFITNITNLIELNEEHLTEVLKYIQDSSLTLINQTFTNEVMSNVSFTSLDKTVGIETTATATGYTVDFSVVVPTATTVSGARGIEIKKTDANYEVALPQGQKNDQIMVWNNDKWVVADQLSRVRQITIPVENGTFSTERFTFFGETTTATNLKAVSIEPVFTGTNQLTRSMYLKVAASAQIEGGIIQWMVNIENNNYRPDNTFTLSHVVISYTSSDEDIKAGNQGYVKHLGF